MYIVLIITHCFDILETVGVFIASIKDQVKNSGYIYTVDSGMYQLCLVSASLQFLSLVEVPFIVTALSLTYYTGLKYGAHRTKRVIALSVSLLAACILLPSGVCLLVFLVSKPYVLSDTCSFIWTQEAKATDLGGGMANVLVAIYIVNYILTVKMFKKAHNLVTESAVSVGSSSGKRFGGRQGGVRQMFINTVLVPVVGEVTIVIALLFMLYGVAPYSTTDLVLALHIIPGFAMLNCLMTIIRRMFNRK